MDTGRSVREGDVKNLIKEAEAIIKEAEKTVKGSIFDTIPDEYFYYC